MNFTLVYANGQIIAIVPMSPGAVVNTINQTFEGTSDEVQAQIAALGLTDPQGLAKITLADPTGQ